MFKLKQKIDTIKCWNSETYSELRQAFQPEILANVVNGWKLYFFEKSFILDVWRGTKYASEIIKEWKHLIISNCFFKTIFLKLFNS